MPASTTQERRGKRMDRINDPVAGMDLDTVPQAPEKACLNTGKGDITNSRRLVPFLYIYQVETHLSTVIPSFWHHC